MNSTDSDYRKGYTRGLHAARRILAEAMEGGKGKHKEYVGVFDGILTETETANGTVKEEWDLFQPFEKVYFNNAEEMESELVKACGGHPSTDRTDQLKEGQWRFEYSTKRRNGTGTLTDADWERWRNGNGRIYTHQVYVNVFKNDMYGLIVGEPVDPPAKASDEDAD